MLFPEQDARISEALAVLYRSEAGKVVFAWLRAVAQRPLPANSTLGEYAYQEGIRWVEAEMLRRVDRHITGEVNVSRKPRRSDG